jgi:hypothetical protein
MIMIGIRACGGMAQTEDRLNAATRWTAEKTGLMGAKDTLDAKVRPPMAAATRSMSDAIFAGVSRAMDRVESTADGFVGWVVGEVRGALGIIDSSVSPVLTPAESEEERRERERNENEQQRTRRPE